MEYKTVSQGCPLCKSDIHGSDESHFLCTKCRMLFTSKHIKPAPKKEKPYVTSDQSTTYHMPGCKYAKRIHSPLLIDETEIGTRRACSCIKEIV